MTTPYEAVVPIGNSPRWLYRSVASVLRLTPTMEANGGFALAWSQISDIVDPVLGIPGQMACRLDLTYVRTGKDQPPTIVAGRAPDRVGVLFFDPATDESGIPLVKAGDRITMVSGPIFGTFDVRNIPDPVQDYMGTHHIEVQVIEVSQALTGSTPTPFPGGTA
jgi:hypothetical protein